jgi:hypothetical protein
MHFVNFLYGRIIMETSQEDIYLFTIHDLETFVLEGANITGSTAIRLREMEDEQLIDVLAATEEEVLRVDQTEGMQNRRQWLGALIANRGLIESMYQTEARHRLVGQVLCVPDPSGGISLNGGSSTSAELGKYLANPWGA